MFKKIEGASAILRKKGAYKVASLYEFNGQLFVGDGRTFHHVYADMRTSQPDCSMHVVHIDQTLFADRHGVVHVTDATGRKLLVSSDEGTLIAPPSPPTQARTRELSRRVS